MNEQLSAIIMIVLVVFVIASIIIGIVNALRINSLLEYSEDGDLVENLNKYYENVRDLQKKLKISSEGSMSERISACESKVNMTLSKTGIVNFNAYDDVHGNQSFALAVLNQYNDGFVITSLYGNSSSNTYVRSVREGKSTTKLLNEEIEAIRKAMSGNIE
ncbi:MAG: DUF4446 family protein [Clostridiales bacterium]|nr:DUF4446 family protein [Clostridiales bacterium]